MKIRTPAIAALFFLSGCVNPYAKFYRGQPDARLGPQYDPEGGKLQIYGSDNFERDVRALMRTGYQPIGESSFNTGQNAPESQLREHAMKIGAHVALISTKYSHTVSGAVPLSVPQVATSYSQGTATAYGSGGWVNAYGNATTTTYGSQTVMMPYSIARYDVNVVYLAKVRARVGITPAPIDDETRRRLQTNAGVKVDVVTEGTPAFAADVMPGDIILAVADQKVQSPEHYIQLLNTFEGQTVAFTIDREGKTILKQLQIRTYPKTTK